MKSKTSIISRHFFAICALIVTVSAKADIVQYSYIHSQYSTQEKIVEPSSIEYLSANSLIEIHSSAGLDRKIRIRLTNAEGASISSSESGVISASDRFTVGGKSYFGKSLNLTVPSNGSYSVVQEILTSNNELVEKFTKKINIDTTLPTSNEKLTSKGHGTYSIDTQSEIWKLGLGSMGIQELYLSNISDNFGIKNIVVESYREDGRLHKSKTYGYNSSTRVLDFNYTDLFPSSNLDELFKLKVKIYDLAGNVKIVEQQLYFDNYVNAPTEPYAVFDPNISTSIVPNTIGYVPYVAGMAVKTNPIQVIYRLDRNNWHEFNEAGLSLHSRFENTKLVYSDARYAYVTFKAPIGNFNYNDVRWNNFGTWGGATVNYNLVLHPDAPPTPKLSSETEFYYSDIGWSSWLPFIIPNSRLPLTINKMRVNVIPRNYEQEADHRGYTCTIPAGSGSCIIEFPENFMKLDRGTTGYLHEPMMFYKSDKSLYGTNSWAEVDWNDAYYPEITPVFDERTSTLRAEIYQEGFGSYFERLKLNKVWLEDSNGKVLQAKGGEVSQNRGNYIYEWDLSTLDAGSHEVNVLAKENHGPITKEFALRFVSDKSAPIVEINFNGNSNSIASLDDVVITAFDNESNITLTGIQLVGGPANENVYLTSRSLGSNKYSLLYPVLFPSENESGNYTLKVTATDTQGNATTALQNFFYDPPRVALNDGRGSVLLPNIKQSILRNTGANPIQSETLIVKSKNVTGSYPVFATLRSDAVGSVVIQGVTLSPGETKTITESYNFLLNDSKYNLGLTPSDTSIKTTGSMLIGSTAPNTPVLVFSYDFKDLEIEGAVTSEPYAVIEPMTSEISLLSTSQFCQSLTHDLNIAKNSNAYGSPVCLVTHVINAVNKTEATKGNKVSFSAYMASLSYETMTVRVTTYSGPNKYTLGEYTYEIKPKGPDEKILSKLNSDVSTILHEIELAEVTAKFDTFTGCGITGDKGIAMDYAFDKTDNNGETKCYLEWIQLPKGISKVGSSVTAKGYAEEVGVQKFSWKLSIFHDGDQSLLISSGTADSKVVIPKSPSLLATTLSYSNGRISEGVEHLLRDSGAKVKSIQFSVEPRDFVQVIKLDGLTCNVPIGINECRIALDIGPLGDQESNISGMIPIDTLIDSNIPYFLSRNEGRFNHKLDWDYTPPKLVKVAINNKRDGTVLVEDVDGTEIKLNEDEVALILFSPFTDLKDDETWKLENSSLFISSDEEITFEQSVLIDRNHFFFIHDKINLNDENRILADDIQVYGNYIVYRYSFKSLPDGAFTFDVDLRDQYTNGQDYKHDTFIMQRTAPEIQLSYLRDKARMVDGVYFATDFGAVTNPGWDSNNTIFEATFGGEKLTLVDDPSEPRKNVKFFQGDLASLTAGKLYPLVIKARDTAGNIGVFNQELTYAPSFFNIKSSTGIAELYQYVQRGTAYVSQSRYLCNYVASQELAREISRDARKGCYVKIDSLPDGMNTIWQGWALKVTGSINKLTDNEIEYSAYVVNPDGQEVRVSHETFSYDIKPAETMTFEMSPIIKLDDNVYGVIPENPVLARYTLENVSGEVNINVTRGEFSNSEFMAQRSHKPLYELLGVIRDDDAKKRNVFDRYPFKVEASYNLSPQHNAGTYGEVIVLPSRRVALNLTMESNDVILSTDDVKVTAHIGAWNWQEKQSDYDVLSMGEWDIYLAYKDNKGKEQRISDVKTNAANGQVIFNLSIEAIFRKSSGFYAVAAVKSPHPEYTQKLTSTPIFMRIVLGTGVSGELVSNQVRGKVPFTTLVRYDYDTIEDMVAGNDTVWLKSKDNKNWESMDEYSGRSAIPFFMSEAGDYFVKAKITNKNTNESTTTQSLKISGYEKASLVISGPTQVYDGQDMKLNMLDYVKELTDYDGIAQWSRDNGASWVDGSPHQILVATGEQEVILGRFKYHSSTAGAGDEAWALSRFYVRPVGPRTVMAQIKATHLVELGVPIKVEAQVLNLNGGVDLPIVYQWTKPNGETSDEVIFDYTPVESDLDAQGRLNFKLRAWIKGYKSETFRETQRNLETWKYVFPEMNIAVRSNILVAPATITGMIEVQRKFMPGITYDYEWIQGNGIEARTPTRIYSEITLKDAGVHELKAKVTDSRGMSRILSKFVDVIEPDETKGTFIYFPSNRYSRAPLGLVTRAQMTGGHPKDYIIDYKWFVNGIEQETLQSRSPMFRFEIENPGNYEIKAVTTSQYGQVTEVIENYTVNANSLPECVSDQLVRSGTIRITANCKDSDGYVIGYDWWFNGEYVGRGAASTQLRLSEYPSMTVNYEAIDDAGGRTKGSFSW
ncbi:DUF4165 domain-containing protein [Pseudoalteromonas sp. SG44-1]|uniref:Ig-like domain-containing protein n=1 Tax=Pseudoalteromonas sp. SG44-1 TaxID=2760964 RepID=UPI0016011D23|nr:Ig-like domain-containing protein [Pseudoalteromonas sp. SG44-1]MBB1417397.1 DUF4165 domain-containing protein [Pseudoalteromonas sp. SG44-1]